MTDFEKKFLQVMKSIKQQIIPFKTNVLKRDIKLKNFRENGLNAASCRKLILI